MTAKEYREKEQITDANFWDGDEIDFNMVYEFAEDYHSEQLRLHIVSKRLFLCDICGQEKSGKKFPVLDENCNKQSGLNQCEDCFKEGLWY